MHEKKHLFSVFQLTKCKILEYISKAQEMKRLSGFNSPLLKEKLQGKILISMFYEPSTRTSASFQSAMLKLGGNVISITDKYSSVEKGETLEDTIKTLNSYGDAIVLRHPIRGSSIVASQVSDIPIINAGDGNGEHPTQALLDIFTINQRLMKYGININNENRDDINVTFVGDLKNSRTIHSLIQVLCLFPKISFIYVSPPSLQMPEEIINRVHSLGIHQKNNCYGLEESIKISDVVYMTRIQKERFANEEEYYNVINNNNLIIDRNIMMTCAKESMILMHPLPRNNEISVEVDSDPRAAYFDQVKNGVYMRMAILDDILGD
jgi:carbamoyl-phosphate synthase/aspartate carbamoyltransferase